MPKVSVLALVRSSYTDVCANWRGLVRIAAVWFVLLSALFLLAWDSLAILALGLPASLAMVAVAVIWHRHVIEGAALTAWVAPLNGRVLHYLWRSFLCTVVSFPIVVVLASLFSLPFIFRSGDFDIEVLDQPIVNGAMFGIMAVPIVYVFARLHMVLPAAAIRDGVTGFVASWRATQGNGWRLVVGMALVAFPIGAATRLLFDFLTGLAVESGSIAARLLSAIVWAGGDLLGAALLAALLSRSYLFFRQSSAPVTA